MPLPKSVDSSLLLTFVDVARSLCLSKTASALHVSPSTVTRRMDELEAAVGVRLLDRGTRSVALTEAGAVFCEYLNRGLAELDMGFAAIEAYGREVKGVLRISTPTSIGQAVLGAELPAFLAKFPELSVSVRLEQRPPNLDLVDFDIALRLGMPMENRAVVSRIGLLREGWFAPAPWVKALGREPVAADLMALPLVAYDYVEEPPSSVAFPARLGEPLIGRVPHLASNDPSFVLAALAQGNSVGKMAFWMAAPCVARGVLVNVLPELNREEPLYSMVPSSKGNSQKVRVGLDFLRDSVAPSLQRLQDVAEKSA